MSSAPNNFAALFTPVRIGNVEIKNRIALAPMSLESIVPFESGHINSRCKEYLIERAKGGTGLIIFSCWRVDDRIEPMHHFHCNYLTKAAMYSIIELVEILHSFDTKVFFQLTAGFGRVGSVSPPGGGRPVSCSAISAFWDPAVTCRALTTAEVEALVQQFGYWAAELRKAEADGIELHAHEGYLFDQFSSAVWNKRTDKYGGDLEGRLTFAKEILQQIKTHAGADFPVVYRYGLKHNMKGPRSGAVPGEVFQEYGRDIEEGLELARILEREGYDGLHVDAGAYDSWYWPHPPNYLPHGCMLDMARRAKAAVDIPVIAVGRLDNPQVACDAIATGDADMVAVGRGMLADPDWANKVKHSEIEQIRPCLGCHDACTGRLFNGKPMCCAVNPTVGRELHYKIRPAAHQKKILIIGGGPAGMEAARVAALRGHSVSLHERRERLGGHLVPGMVPEFKRDIGRLLEWYERQLATLDVTIYLQSDASTDTLAAESADEIVIATGSKPAMPRIQGLAHGVERGSVVHCIDALNGTAPMGREVVVLGGGLVGCEIALWRAVMGDQVTLVEMQAGLMSVGPPVSKENKQMTIDLLKYHDVRLYLNTTIHRIGETELELIDNRFRYNNIAFETLVVAAGMQAERQLYLEADQRFKNVRRIGDCLKVRNIQGAIWDAYEVVRRI